MAFSPKTLAFAPARSVLTALTIAITIAAPVTAKTAEEDAARYELVQAQLVEDIGAAERVEAADILRTMTQEVAAAACFLYTGIDTAESQRLMIEGRDKFNKNLDALLYGNTELNIIGGETRRKTIVFLEEIRDYWAPMSGAATALAADPDDSAAVGIIKANNVPLHDLTETLVSDIAGQYSNPAELLQADALLLDIVGRQGMLTQKISKNACKVWNGEELARSTSELTGAMQMFETSLGALLHGMPDVGVKAAPTPEIASALEGVLTDWSTTRPVIDTLLSAGAIDPDDKVVLFRAMNDKMYRLEKLAHKYALYSKYK